MILHVRDSGIGIDKQVKERLFEKFVTKSEGGTGLGLYVTKRIILAHGGRISGIPNKDGVGSTFAFSIPRNLLADASPLGQFRPESKSSISRIETVHAK